MTVVAMILVFLFAAYVFRNYFWRIMKTKWYGTETEGFVSRITEERMSYTYYAGTCYNYYACFRRKDGLQAEVRLLNPKARLATGSRIRLKVLDESVSYAVLTEIIHE